jgi:hypothetical protein
MLLPSAIIFINADMTVAQKQYIGQQLYITETISGQEFDARVVADPNYPDIVHQQNLRILVVRDDFRDYTNRELADIAIFVKQGLIAIEKNKFGPPNLTFQQDRVNIYELLRAVDSNQVVILPTPPPRTIYPCDCKLGYGLGGIFAIELQSSCLTICPNPDNERNNQAFINRK